MFESSAARRPAMSQETFATLGENRIAYIKAMRPEIRIIGVQMDDSDAMVQSISAGHRVQLDDVGLFSDGTYGDGFNGVEGSVRGLFYGGASQLVAQVIGTTTCFVFIFSRTPGRWSIWRLSAVPSMSYMNTTQPIRASCTHRAWSG